MGKPTDATGDAVEGAAKVNCWEHKKCGRQPGGQKVEELGVCPASINEDLNTAHGGKNAGRACWVVVGSLCGGKIQGTYAKKLLNCWRCDFMNRVKKEEEPNAFGFSHTRLGMERAIEKQRNRIVEGTAAVSMQEAERH